jgi:hypothetical protein
MKSNAVLFAETYNYFPFKESSLVLRLSIPCNFHQTGLGSTLKLVPFQLCFTGGMEYTQSYRLMIVMIKWEKLDEVVTCLMVLRSGARGRGQKNFRPSSTSLRADKIWFPQH